MIKKTQLVYGVLILAWALIVAWQVVEHGRVRQSARAALINRAKDISNTLGLVLRSQRRFGVIPRDRLESALNELVKPGELNAIAVLSASGEVVASVGTPIDLGVKDLVPTGVHWGESSVTLMNLVDLGTNMTSEAEENRPTLVLPRSEFPSPPGTNRPPFPPFRGEPNAPPIPPPPGSLPAPDPAADDASGNVARPGELGPPPPRPHGWPRRGGEGRPRFGRPFWMSEEEYRSAIQKQGVHSFVVMLSSQFARDMVSRDLWLRAVISVFAFVAAGGLGWAWRNLAKSSDLEVRLARAAELNTRLKDMNLAAAGLAHETKNPLNIIRGLAQMILKESATPPQIRQQSRTIVDEVDRVTAQLNEFIHFSRPREVRRGRVALASVVAEVGRALGPDVEEKSIRLQVQPDLPCIEADEQLLRQALFNLLLNATQAVPPQGEIQVVATKDAAGEAVLEIRDDGPGVPPEQRKDIFKPYFTTTQTGTGLGLAVVQQIVLAHGWEIECLPNAPRGAVFRLAHLRLSPNP
jgi:signal transduction histidine kinase